MLKDVSDKTKQHTHKKNDVKFASRAALWGPVASLSSVDENQHITSRSLFKDMADNEIVYKCEIERANTLERLSRTVGGLQVGITGRAVGGGVILEVEKEGEHVASWCPPNL